MMYTFGQARREAAQIQIDLEDLARAVDRLLPDRMDISRELRLLAGRVAEITCAIRNDHTP